jgi:restriction endonuclease S subunit
MRSFIVPLPPLNEQAKIVEAIYLYNKKCDEILFRISKIQEIKLFLSKTIINLN